MTEELNGKPEGAMTRRELRASYQSRPTAVARRAPAAAPAAPVAQASAPKRKSPIKRFANVFVLLAAAGIVGTVALPAYAFNPGSQSHADSSATVDTMTRADAQSANITAAAKGPTVSQDQYQATSITEIDSAHTAALAAAAQAATAKAAAYSAAYTGPTAAQYLTQTPSGTSYSLAAVFAKAQQYIGDPYQLGGSTPAGFDCSGFVMFVYAQFGVALPHSASEIAHIGQTISLADAQPGDVIALNDGSHVGFYAGRNAAGDVMILDAPKPGGHVSIRELWTTAYHIQHIGNG